MPGWLTVAVELAAPEIIPGPDQMKETGDDVVVATAFTDVFIQSNVAVAIVLILGEIVFAFTWSISDAKQPFDGSVTVNV